MARYCIEDFEGPRIPKETILKYKNKTMVEPYEESKAINYEEENYKRNYDGGYGVDYGTGSDNDTAYNVDNSPASNTTEIVIISVCSVISFIILFCLIFSGILGWKRPNHWFGGIGLLLRKIFGKPLYPEELQENLLPNGSDSALPRNKGGDRTKHRRRRHISSSINYNPNEFSNSNDLYGMPI